MLTMQLSGVSLERLTYGLLLLRFRRVVRAGHLQAQFAAHFPAAILQEIRVALWSASISLQRR